MNVCVLDGVAGGHHHPVSKVDAAMAHPRRIIGSFKENQIAWFCFCFGNMLALVPQAVGGGAPHIIAVLVVDPADITATIEPGFRGRTAPNVGCTNVFLGLRIDGSKFAVGQSFCRNLIIDARCAGAIRAAGR